MSSKPSILVEKDDNTVPKYGSFRIDPKTKWLPLCPERGTIVAAADGKPLPALKVRALGGERMELTNIGDFSAERLGGTEFLINGAEGAAKKEMSCAAQITSIFYGAGSATTHTCSFAKKSKKSRK
jgi:hypothetical protein